MAEEKRPEPKMVRVLNKHTAGVDGIPAGAEGEVDETSGGIQHLLAQGLLVPVDGAVAARPALADLEQALADQAEWIEKMERALREKDARIVDLEQRLAQASAPAAPEEKPVEAAPKGKK